MEQENRRAEAKGAHERNIEATLETGAEEASPESPDTSSSDYDSDSGITELLREIYEYNVFEETPPETLKEQEEPLETEWPPQETASNASTTSDVDTICKSAAFGDLSELQNTSSLDSVSTAVTAPHSAAPRPPSPPLMFNPNNIRTDLNDCSQNPENPTHFINQQYLFGPNLPPFPCSISNVFNQTLSKPQPIVHVPRIGGGGGSKYLCYQTGSSLSLTPQQTVNCAFPPMFCDYCFECKQPPYIYHSHFIRDRCGNLACLRLRHHVCQICGSTGADAHIEEDCPMRQ